MPECYQCSDTSACDKCEVIFLIVWLCGPTSHYHNCGMFAQNVQPEKCTTYQLVAGCGKQQLCPCHVLYSLTGDTALGGCLYAMWSSWFLSSWLILLMGCLTEHKSQVLKENLNQCHQPVLCVNQVAKYLSIFVYVWPWTWPWLRCDLHGTHCLQCYMIICHLCVRLCKAGYCRSSRCQWRLTRRLYY